MPETKRQKVNFYCRSIINIESGFTLIELMVAISVMVIMVSMFIINLAGQRASRSLKIAQNELVSNLREAQSYTLSGRNSGVNQAVQYYIERFELNATSYQLQAMYQDAAGNWKVGDIKKISFPQGVSLSGIKIDNVDIPNCGLVAFKTPFAKILMNNGCNPITLANNPYSVVDSDDYKKILTFVTNANGLTTSMDKKMILTLKYQQDSNNTKTVTINGITGLIDNQ